MFKLKPILVVLLMIFPSALMAATGTVVNVIDGDSVVIKVNGEQFQADLIFVDAPEVGEQYGNEAKQYVAEKIKNKNLQISDYGKLYKNNHLVEIFLPTGVSINSLLIENGYARYYSSIKSSDKLVALEKEAKLNKIGIWGLNNKKNEILYSDDRQEVLSYEGEAYYITKEKKYITKEQLRELIEKEKIQENVLGKKPKDNNSEAGDNDEGDDISPCRAQCRSTFPYNNLARAACASLCLY